MVRPISTPLPQKPNWKRENAVLERKNSELEKEAAELRKRIHERMVQQGFHLSLCTKDKEGQPNPAMKEETITFRHAMDPGSFSMFKVMFPKDTDVTFNKPEDILIPLKPSKNQLLLKEKEKEIEALNQTLEETNLQVEQQNDEIYDLKKELEGINYLLNKTIQEEIVEQKQEENEKSPVSPQRMTRQKLMRQNRLLKTVLSKETVKTFNLKKKLSTKEKKLGHLQEALKNDSDQTDVQTVLETEREMETPTSSQKEDEGVQKEKRDDEETTADEESEIMTQESGREDETKGETSWASRLRKLFRRDGAKGKASENIKKIRESIKKGRQSGEMAMHTSSQKEEESAQKEKRDDEETNTEEKKIMTQESGREDEGETSWATRLRLKSDGAKGKARENVQKFRESIKKGIRSGEERERSEETERNEEERGKSRVHRWRESLKVKTEEERGRVRESLRLWGVRMNSRRESERESVMERLRSGAVEERRESEERIEWWRVYGSLGALDLAWA